MPDFNASLNLRIPEQMRAILERNAEERGQKLGEYVRGLLHERVIRSEQLKPAQQPAQPEEAAR